MSKRCRIALAASIAAVLTVSHAGDDVERPPAGVPADWFETVTENIRRAEYEFSWLEDRLSAPNRAQNLRASVAADGFEIAPRTGDPDAFALRLELRGLGRGAARVEAAPGSLSPSAERAEILRAGLTEWLVNTERGIEHGLTIDERPLEGAGELTLRFAVAGLQAYPVEGDDKSLEFRDAAGRTVLRYADLHVFDASEQALAAWLEIGEGEMRIVVDDTGAIYPVTVDPLLTTPGWTYESNSSFAGLGFSVATAGDVNGDGWADVLVGAPGYSVQPNPGTGRVYLFLGTSSGPATSPAWTHTGDSYLGSLGNSVATAGDVNADGFDDVIVGAPGEGTLEAGQAHVFLGSAANPPLSGTPVWTGTSGQSGGRFGHSVAWAGDTNGDGYDDVIVGAPGYDNGSTDEGRAYVFRGNPAGVSAAANWTGESNSTTAQFGWSVSTAGDVNGDGLADIIVGAPFYELFVNNEDVGRIWVYHGGSASISFATILNGANQQGGRFGYSVSTAGDIDADGYADAIIGEPGYDNGQADEGRAVIIHGSSIGLDGSYSPVFEPNQAGAEMGRSVATAGDVDADGYADVIVGIPFWDGGQADEGRAHVYTGPSGGLYWFAESNVAGAAFGGSVATAGDVNRDGRSDILVGASSLTNGSTSEGRAYYFESEPDGLVGAGSRSAGQAGAHFGASLAAGDFNADGYSDLLVGAPFYDSGQADEGAAFVFSGGPGGLATSASWSAQGNQDGAQLGSAVAAAGDVNGDGYEDVLVGAPRYSSAGNVNDGRAVLYLGSAAGPSTIAAWSASSDQNGSNFALAVAGAGDVNNDGLADIAIGAPSFANGSSLEGRVYLYTGDGSGSGVTTLPAWTAESNSVGARFGWSVASAGDVNRDGFGDLLIGAPDYSGGQIEEGRVYLYFGSASGLPATPSWTAEPNQAQALFGVSVATIGDYNGDGYSDFVVGAPLWDNDQVDEGAAFIYRGTATTPASAGWREGNNIDAQTGRTVASAGDVNADGYSDLAIGDPGSNGRVTLWYGAPSGLPGSPSWSDSSILDYSRAMTHGDFNGDGWGDFAVSAPLYGATQATAEEGRVWLFYGGGPGRPFAARHGVAGTSAPIALLGRAPSPDRFTVRANGFTPAGLGQVRMEVETKSLGASFAGTGTVLGPWQTLVPPGSIGMGLAVDTTGPGNDHRWRLRFHSKNPLFPASRWVSLPGNAPSEKDLSITCAVQTWHPDADGDGFGDGASPVLACDPPAGHLADGSDCDDGDDAVNPGAARVDCDGIDNDCSGTPDAPDLDADGVDDCGPGDPNNPDGIDSDNCPLDPNPTQSDVDNDTIGDVCDVCPVSFVNDVDGDGVLGPCIVEPQWRLRRVIDFEAAFGVAYDPRDGKLWAGRRTVAGKGLYRIESDGSATRIWGLDDDIAGIVVDPDDGDVFAADDFSGEIFRTAYGQTGRETWVAGLHADDDDPIGMAIAPAGYVGPVLAPGEALVVDRGSGGLDEIWRWSPDTAEGETVVHADDGTLVNALDVAIGDANIWVVDDAAAATGILYEVGEGGTLTPFVTMEPIPEPQAIAWDAFNAELLVLDGASNGGTRRVLRVDPENGFVSEIFVAFDFSSTAWTGLDVSADGGRIAITDRATNRIFEFIRDLDGDDVVDSLDCDPFDHDVWALPGEATYFLLSHAGGPGGTTTMTWEPVQDPGGTLRRYDLLRSTAPDGFGAAFCLESAGADTTATDTSAPGSVYYYLVVPVNDCGGNAGTESSGAARVVTSCP